MLQNLKSLIAVGKTQEAISRMAKIAAANNSSLYNDLILLSGQVAKNQSMFTLGLLDLDDFKIAESKNNFAVLSIVDAIEAENMLEKELHLTENEDIEKTKLLFLASNPSDLNPLQLEKEFIEIRKILKSQRNLFETTEAFDVSLDLFFEEIALEKPHVIHFTGYGTDLELVFSRKTDRTQHYVPYEFLASALKLMRGNVECIFINTRGSALFAKVVSRFVPFAIGITGDVLDDEAISFASGFYAALAIEKDYEKAFKNGKDLFLAQQNAQAQRVAQTVAPPEKKVKKETKKEAEAPSALKKSDYYLFKNGFSEDDKDLPDDYYMPLAAAQK